MLIGFVALYLLLTLLIGYWASTQVKTTDDFVIAGRKMPMVVAASALFATWFGSETVMGASSEFVEHGLIGVVEDPFGAALCLVLVGVFYARPLYRLNILTFNDYYRLRYNRKVEVVSAIFIVPSYFGWAAAQLVAMAVILQALVGLPMVYGILLCTFIVLFYTYIGGMWAVSVTDFVQTIMIVIGMLVLAAQVLDAAGGLQQVLAQTPEGFFRFLPEPTFTDSIHYFAAWITIGLGSIPAQDVFQRVLSAKSEKTAVHASYLSGVMYLTIGFLPLCIALCSMTLYPDISANDTQMVLPQMVLQHTTLPIQILFFGALLSAILSSTSGAMLAPATVMGENLIRPQFKRLTDKQLLRVMRLSVLFIAIGSAVMAMLQSNIYDLVGQSSALTLVSLFVPLTAGLYWRKASRMGAMLAMFAGGGVWLVCEIIGTEIPSLIYGAAVSVLGMIVGSYLASDESHAEFVKKTGYY